MRMKEGRDLTIPAIGFSFGTDRMSSPSDSYSDRRSEGTETIVWYEGLCWW